jgi:hypothetical protein
MFHDPAGTLKALIGILPKHAKLEITTPTDSLSDERLEQLAVQVGEHLEAFMPDPDGRAFEMRLAFAAAKARWFATFYGQGTNAADESHS